MMKSSRNFVARLLVLALVVSGSVYAIWSSGVQPYVDSQYTTFGESLNSVEVEARACRQAIEALRTEIADIYLSQGIKHDTLERVEDICEQLLERMPER